MRKARALKSGDRLAIVAPASPFKREEFDSGVAEVRKLGFEPVFDDTVFARRGYVAGEPAVRAAAIHQAWRDPSIAGIIAVRGGYGSAQLLPLLDVEAAKATRKPFVAYSDLTAILSFLTLKCGLVSFHGPMLAGRLGLGETGYDRSSFEKVLCRTEPAGELAPEGLEVLRRGEASGLLLGGTITQIVASLGTPYAFDPPPGYVLFFEEVGERPYRLDRMVTQLRQANLLSKASAIVIGELKDCVEPSGGPPIARDVMADVFSEFPGPVIFNFPSGHTVRPSITLPLGVRCRVVAGPKSVMAGSKPVVAGLNARLIIEEAAVE